MLSCSRINGLTDRQTVGVEWVVVCTERVSVLTDRLLGLTGLWTAWSGS